MYNIWGDYDICYIYRINGTATKKKKNILNNNDDRRTQAHPDKLKDIYNIL